MGIEDQLLDAGYEIQQLRSVDSDGKVKAELPVEAIRNPDRPRLHQPAARRPGRDGVPDRGRQGRDRLRRHHHGRGRSWRWRAPHVRERRAAGIRPARRGRRPALERPPTGLRHRAGGRALPRLQGGGLCGRRLPPTRRAGVSDLQHARPPGGQVALREDRTPVPVHLPGGTHRRGAQPKDELRTQFGDAGWECPQMLDALDDADDLYFDVVSQIKMDHWSRGRVGSSGTPRAASHCLAARAPAWR